MTRRWPGRSPVPTTTASSAYRSRWRTARACRAVRCASTAGAADERQLPRVAHALVPDPHVDRVRGGVPEIGVEEAESPSTSELLRRDPSCERARVTVAAVLRLRVHGADPDPVRRRPAEAGERDELAVHLP